MEKNNPPSGTRLSERRPSASLKLLQKKIEMNMDGKKSPTRSIKTPMNSRESSGKGRRPSLSYGDTNYAFSREHEDSTRTVRQNLGSDVASMFSNKVSTSLDFYSDILRRRMIRELEAPVKIVVDEIEDDDLTEDLPKEDKNAMKKVIPKTQAISAITTKKKEEEDTISQKLKLHARQKSVVEMQKMLRRLEVRQRFRKKVRIIIFCIRCVWRHCFKFRERSDISPYMNTLNHYDFTYTQVKDLMFDRSLYRAHRQARVPEEFRRIMSMRKSDRTEQELYSAVIAMRNVKSVAILPARMQQMIAQMGQYEAYEARRVITREGHPPCAYYFLLSGSVVAMKKVPDRDIASAVAEYHKGETFEENVMVTESPREVTVLTKEPCEFLSISAADYKTIYMQGGVKNLSDPDQELFLKGLSFLENWPLHLLQENPKVCRFYYFKRGAILADDTKKSEWLIIVKSGSISVLKKLKKVGPYEWRKNTGPKPLTDKERRERNNQKEQWRRYVLSELKLPLRQKKDIEEIEERVDGKPKPFAHPNIKVHFDQAGGPKVNKYYYPSLWTIVKNTSEDEKDIKNKNFSNISKQHLYLISNTGSKNKKKQEEGSRGAGIPGRTNSFEMSKSLQDSPFSGSEVSLRSLLCSPEDPDERALQGGLSSGSILFASATNVVIGRIRVDTLAALPRNIVKSNKGSSNPTRTPSSLFDERLKTIAAEVDIGLSELTDADLNPEFVKIQTLIKGGVWGLADLILEEQASFMVVSNGADCILLSKQFYDQHCSEKLRRKLTQELCPYPSDSDLQDSLQVSVDWSDYRECELSNTMNVVRSHRVQRDVVFTNT